MNDYGYILENTNIDEFKLSPIEECMYQLENSDDIVYNLESKIELVSLSKTGNITESAIANRLISEPTKDPEDLSFYVPTTVPYFTPEEIIMFGGKSTEFLSTFKQSCSSGLYNFDYTNHFTNVQSLYERYKKSPSIELEQEIISLGWNPSVEPNEANLKIAQSRMKKYIKENYDFTIVDVSQLTVHEEVKPSETLYPVFIVLSFTNTPFGRLINKAVKSKYSHACIAFEPDLKHMYTYNLNAPDKKLGGLAYESIEDYRNYYEDAKIKVLCVFVDKQQKAKIRARLDYYVMNDEKTHYNIPNLFNLLLNKAGSDIYDLNMICSQFVDAILKSADIDLMKKSSNLVAPVDFERSKDKKVFILFEGYIRDYNVKKISKKVNALACKRSSQYKLVGAVEAAKLVQYHDILLYKSIRIDNSISEGFLEELSDLLTATPILTEAKKFPFSIKDNGDLEINFPDQLEAEYQKSHKLLLEYDKANNIEGMKSELAKLWYLNNTAEKKLKGKKKEEVTKTRARILNDFKKYLEIVLKKEKDFNFTEYFNASPYYDKSVSIDASTLRWSGKLLKSLALKSV